MLKNWKPHIVAASLVGGVVVYGCFDFKDAQSRCEQAGRCLQDDGGTPQCTPNDNPDSPDDTFADTNCDGVDGMADAGIFVDPNGGVVGATGTASDPVKTLGEALDRVRTGTAPRTVYLAQGSYDEPGLVLDTQVSLYGAYGGRTNWQRKNEYLTHLDGGTTGLVIRGIAEDAGVVLDRVTVSSANASDFSAPSIALQVVDSQGVRLRYDTFSAGQGGMGADGVRGASGLDGGAGMDGGNAVQANAGGFGAGGMSNCGGTNTSGGDGQDGVSGAYAPGTAGVPGQPAELGGAGGDAGEAGSPLGSSPIICRAGDGGVGSPGKPGASGSAGAGGEGLGQLSGSMWVATQQGGKGDAGTPGGGGGGGGSGGSCKREGTVAGAAGAGSGGGGAGGCGGEGGGGGGGGGASISALLVRSNVTFEGDTVLRTRGGGRGGAGAEGGAGGGGGPSGAGGTADIISSGTYNSYGGNGGAGGPGGGGGGGGPGGGGGGGPSVGIWCGPDASFVGSVTPQLGNGGTPGTGSPNGNPGQPGQQIPYQGCP